MRLVTLFLTGLVLALGIIGVAVWLTPLPDEEMELATQPAADNQPSAEDDVSVAGKAQSVEVTLKLPESARQVPTQQLQDELRAVGKQLTETFPGESGSWHLAAQVEAELLQSESAELLWNRCLEMNPQHFGPYLGLAELLTSTGRFQDAADILQQVFERGGSSPEVYLKLGEAYENLGELPRALEVLSEGAKLFPEDASLLFSLGRLQSQAEELEAAEANIKQAIAVGGQSQQYLSSLITVLMRQNKREEAVALRQQLKDLTTPSDVEQDAGGAAFQQAYDKALGQSAFRVFEGAGALCYKQGRLDLAEQYFVRAVEQDPSITSGWVGLSEVLLHQGKFGDVIQVLKRIVKLEPENPFHRTNLAAVAMQVGDLQLAQSTLEEALAEDPKSELLLVALSKLYLGTTQLDKAKQSVESLLALNTSPEVRQLQATIEQAIEMQNEGSSTSQQQ